MPSGRKAGSVPKLIFALSLFLKLSGCNLTENKH